MKTLYDLLGAFPDDDAEALRDAFRNAVKATHPDVNFGDPDAPLKFRQIVRANAVLSDPQQREAYDRLLAAAEHPARAFVKDTFRKLAADAIAVVILAAILVAGYELYALCWPTSNASYNPARAIEAIAARGPAETTVAISAGETDVAGRLEASDKLRGMKLLSDAMRSSTETAATSAAGAQGVGNADPAHELALKDAKFYRERGIAAYGDGDLSRALANLDLAIQLEPSLRENYVNRGIVLYRMEEFDRAFADIAQVKRIESAAASKLLLRKPSPSGRN
jgi:tetratricopeptide (TPR) repeat protein